MPSKTTVIVVLVVVNDGVLVTTGWATATDTVDERPLLGNTELPLGSLSEVNVTEIVPATVPWLNWELLPAKATALLCAGSEKVSVLCGDELQDAFVTPLANCTSSLRSLPAHGSQP